MLNLSFGLLLCFVFSFSLNASTVNPPDEAQGWELAYDQNGIKISYQMDDCTGEELFYFKIENDNSASQMLDIVGEIKEGSDIQPFHFRRNLDANSTLEDLCPSQITPVGLYIQLMYPFSTPNVTISLN